MVRPEGTPMPQRIAILHGRERTFPAAFIAEVNRRNVGVVAEEARIPFGSTERSRPYDVIVDRISHEVPFYQTWLKQQSLEGARVINNPFWRLADDKYFGTCLAKKLGIAVPRSIVLPQRAYVEDISPESLTNMLLTNWEEVAAFTGWPCFLKPTHGGGWKSVHKCSNMDELLQNYNKSGQTLMMLQEGIQWEAYARLVCIGKKDIRIAPWNPDKPHHERYSKADFHYGPELEALMVRQGQLLNEALGYDMNTVEFAIRDGVPYAIDFMNTSPDFDANSLTPETFNWVVNKMADLTIRLAQNPSQSDVPPRCADLI
jgi:glutathione synthase/RimK-type ligase-like ATP-grasp enzyme